MDDGVRSTALSLLPLVRAAVRQFWTTRTVQASRQGGKTGVRDQGARKAVTGGAHLDGFVELLQTLLVLGGVPHASIFCKTRVALPGYFRPEKKWDLVVVHKERLLATVEFKAHIGPSFGNNCNNRAEEALGNATDYWTAYREGAFDGSPRPWLGYVMLLEETDKSTRPVRVMEPHFPVRKEFVGASYAQRYESLLLKLKRERLYDGAWLLLTPRSSATIGEYSESNTEIGFELFGASLLAHMYAHTSMSL